MNQPAPHLHLQSDGPHLRPGPWPARRNWGLLALLLPVMGAALAPFPPGGTSWSWPLALAGSLAGVIIFSPNRRQTLPKLDWAITAVLAGLMIALPQYRAAEFYLAPVTGFLCGLLVSRPEASYLLGRPGLIAWLALLAGHILFRPHLGEMRLEPSLYRAAALALPAFFIAPQMARSRLELLIYEALLVLWLFHPFPALGWISNPTLLWSGLIFAPRCYLDRRRKRPRPVAISSRPAPDAAGQTARIKCGHQGRAARLAQWRGLPSCRLAADHDQGQLLCPYGCLGLGDCRRACPAEAISLENGFPVIDPRRCLGCGKCRAICPKQLFELLDGETRAFIPCASRSGLKNNARYCDQSCLGCGKCRKACPAKAIGRSGDSGAMNVDQAACQAYGDFCGQVCRQVCPRKII